MWTVRKINGIPKQVRSAASVVVGDKIYSFGDVHALDDYQEIKPMNVHIMETVDYQWRVLKTPDYSSLQDQEIPVNRTGHTAVAQNDLVYIFGGFLIPSMRCEGSLYCFDTKTHLWSRPSVHGEKPVERANHSACVINNSMYIFGGSGLENQLARQQVYKLNLNSFEWSLVRTRGEPPICRNYSATAINNCIYFFGGWAEQRGEQNPVGVPDAIYDDQVIVLDTQTRSWIRPEVNGYRPVGRMAPSAFCYRGQLLIFGGFSKIIRQEKYHNDMVRYDPVLDFKLNQDGLPETIRAHIKGIITTPIPQLSCDVAA